MEAILLIIIGALAVGFGMAVWQMYALRRTVDLALEDTARADERVAEVQKIHQELLARPVQVIMPVSSAELIAQTIVQYLQNSQTEVIWPSTKKEPN